MSSTARSLSHFESPSIFEEAEASHLHSVDVTPQKISELVDQTWIALLGFCNLLAFGVFARSSVFTEVREELVWMFGLVSVALGALMLSKNARGAFREGFVKLRAGEITWELLASIGITLVYVSAVLEVFLYVPFGYSDSPFSVDLLITFSLFFCSALILALARLFTSYFERGLAQQSSIGVESLFGMVPVLGRTLKALDGEVHEKEKAYTEVKPGDIIRISEQSYIPCDGVILKGACELEERKYTGATELRAKSSSMEVFAGSRVTRGEIVVKVVNSFSDSVMTTFLDTLKARLEKARPVDVKLRTSMTLGGLALLFVAACSGLYWVKSGLDSSEVLLIVCSILFVSVLLAPFTFFRHLKPLLLTALFDRGVLLKDVRVVDQIGQLKNLILHLQENGRSFELCPTEFVLVDQRVDQASLLPVLFSLLGGSDEEMDRAIAQFLRERLPHSQEQSSFYPVVDFAVFPGQGVYGQVEGIDVTIGTEQFLLERGVHVEQSETEPEMEHVSWRYVALGPEIVAKLKLENHFSAHGEAMVKGLRAMGVNVSLTAESSKSDLVDAMGKSFGLELAAIHSGVGDTGLEEKLSGLHPAGLYCNGVLGPKIEEIADVTFSEFDELRWNVDESSVTVFGSPFEHIETTTRACRRLNLVYLSSAGLCLSLAALLVLLSAAGLVNPLVTMLSALGALTACGILSQRVI